MAKFAFLFIAAFCLVQISTSGRIEKRDTADQAIEVTTESLFDSIRSGLKKTFSEENINKAKDSLITAGNKAANFTVDGFNKAKVGFQGLLNKDDVSTPVPAVAAPAA